MKLRRLTVTGFGRLVGRSFAFDDGLNVIYGPNEAGKSTLARSIVASLYGIGRDKDAWRPWLGDAYATTLVYELANGRSYEVQRDYDRDGKGVRVYDRDGNDVASQVVIGKVIAPGETHLQMPREAFVNGSCVLQQAIEIDGTRSAAATIATSLARALDGGPKEDAALGALKRLEDARKTHVGTPLARVNNPLRLAREALAEREREAQAARTTRDALAHVRERRAAAIAERDRAIERRTAAEVETRALRAAELRLRLDDLRTYRDDLAAQHAARARYDDVAGFPADRVADFDAAFYAWQAAERTANDAAEAADAARLSTAERGELAARRIDAGAIDDAAFDALRAAADEAERARATATAAASEAAAARRDGSGGQTLAGIALAVAGVFAVLTIGFAIAHWWSFTEVCGALAALAFVVVALRGRERAARVRIASEKQRVADASLAAERAASLAVVAVLEPLGVTSVEDLARRRERFAELTRKAEHAERASARAEASRADEVAAAQLVDALADELVPGLDGTRKQRHAAARERALRRRERDGIESGIAMLEVRRSEILRGDDEFALLAERDALAAAGIVPAVEGGRGAGDDARSRVRELDRIVRDAEMTVAQLTGELDAGEATVADLAALEEAVVRARAEVDRLEALERAFRLATETVGRLTHEAHQAFARRLETYAATSLGTITAGRYGEIFVDPTTLAVRVRVPETGAIEELAALSAGTRDQIYLLVRFAMTRMFAEGLEMPPLLLDDPFAYWDASRIERCLPLIAQNAFGAQTLLFTSSRELALAAESVGARRIDVGAEVTA
jgi:recombinational DNA repair ATPase RecF